MKKLSDTPLILINLKSYAESIGSGAHGIAQAAEVVSEESGISIGLAPMYPDIHPISHHYSIPVFAQHVSPFNPGAHTGSIPVVAAKSAGAIGSLVNHSEFRLTVADIDSVVSSLKNAGMLSIICSNNVSTTKAVSTFNPDYVAIEPPELIGGQVSVAQANPEIITASVEAAKSVIPDMKVLAGAGIHCGNCVKTAIDLGCSGVLLASSVVKAEKPDDVLRNLVAKL